MELDGTYRDATGFVLLARGEGWVTIDAGGSGTLRLLEVIRGYILASPKITRGRNRQPLIDHGVDVTKYQADWDED